jgi:MarR family transcriptional regulator, lower aerobic nicotinate degradation pathway regulator
VRARVEAQGFPGYRRSDAWTLRLLAREPCALGRLGDGAGITRQAARKLADGLAERGFASLSSDPSDRRRTLVSLTPEGERYARAVASAQRALNIAIRKKVNASDLVAADTVLRAVFPDGVVRRRIDEAVSPPSG